MKIIDKIISEDKLSAKVLQATDDNFVIETGVFDDGNTCHLCVSCQIGCPISCQMCYNGINKNYHRNLTKQEILDEIGNIIEQFELLKRYEYLCCSFMGVGEPMLNYDNVLSAIQELAQRDERIYFALATTLPYSKDIVKLTEDFNNIRQFKLTISLHAPNDKKRKELIPSHSSFEELRKAMNYYKKHSIHKAEFNYVLLKKFNDSDEDFYELLEFLEDDDRLKISSYNPIEGGKFEKTTDDRYLKLHRLLDKRNIHNSKFESVGDKIDVGCGQMAAKKLIRR